MRAPIGFRIRSRRKSLGLSQVGLAEKVGISASYLNLIEASKRDVGGSLMHRIAATLGVELEHLTGDAENRLLGSLREAFADPILDGFPLGDEEAYALLAQMPDCAAALHRVYRAYLDASANADAAVSRLRSDPIFADLLHQMLSQLTAVRSAAEILSGTPDISEDDRQRFLGSINREALALSQVAETLTAQFDQQASARRTVTPRREVDDLLVEEKNYFADLEDIAEALRTEIEAGGTFAEPTLATFLERRFGISVQMGGVETPSLNPAGNDLAENRLLLPAGTTAATRQFQIAREIAARATDSALNARLAKDERLSTDESRRLARRALQSYVAGAMVMPYEAFFEEAQETRYDIAALGQRFTASFEQVAHRLVTLKRPGAEGVPFAFLRADPAGRLTKHFPLPGLVLPNTGHACPLWAIYAAFRTPDTVVRQAAAFQDGSRYLFIASASAKRVVRFAEQPFYTAVMLACDMLHADQTVYGRGGLAADPVLDTNVGPTCRLCVRRDCAHRQEGVQARFEDMRATGGTQTALGD